MGDWKKDVEVTRTSIIPNFNFRKYYIDVNKEVMIMQAFKITDQDSLDISSKITDLWLNFLLEKFKKQNPKLKGRKLQIKFGEKLWSAIDGKRVDLSWTLKQK